jgi:hypothetical protein
MIIPSGMTSLLQPINKPFKHRVRKHYAACLNKHNHILTPNGKIKRSSTSIMVEWMSKAWKELPGNIIPKSFSKCCLSDAEDGTQDDLFWDESEPSGEGA